MLLLASPWNDAKCITLSDGTRNWSFLHPSPSTRRTKLTSIPHSVPPTYTHPSPWFWHIMAGTTTSIRAGAHRPTASWQVQHILCNTPAFVLPSALPRSDISFGVIPSFPTRVSNCKLTPGMMSQQVDEQLRADLARASNATAVRRVHDSRGCRPLLSRPRGKISW